MSQEQSPATLGDKDFVDGLGLKPMDAWSPFELHRLHVIATKSTDDSTVSERGEFHSATNAGTDPHVAPLITEYSERAERQQAASWLDVCNLLSELAPDWRDSDGYVGVDKALNTIRKLASATSAIGKHPDTLRYRWLADKVIAPDYGDNDSSPHRKGYNIMHCKGPDAIYGDSLDAAIDEMIKLENPDVFVP